MYDTLAITDLQALRSRFLNALRRPNLANRAQVEQYLTSVEHRLLMVAGDRFRQRDTAPSIHDMRIGKRQPRNSHDAERMAWSHWS